MNTVAWKAYEEVHFSDKYILRWIREGDEYVNKITKEMMEDLKSVVRQQQAEIEALKTENSHLKYEISSGAWNPVPLTDAELAEVYEEVYINYAGKDFPVDLGRAILRKAQEK